MISVALLW